MDKDTAKLRRQVQRLGRADRGRRVPPQLRARLTAAARKLRSGGASWVAIGEALGVTGETARRWCASASTGTALVPVQVAEPEEQPVSLVSPSGYRVEGLSLEQAAKLLRALS